MQIDFPRLSPLQFVGNNLSPTYLIKSLKENVPCSIFDSRIPPPSNSLQSRRNWNFIFLIAAYIFSICSTSTRDKYITLGKSRKSIASVKCPVHYLELHCEKVAKLLGKHGGELRGCCVITENADEWEIGKSSNYYYPLAFS